MLIAACPVVTYCLNAGVPLSVWPASRESRRILWPLAQLGEAPHYTIGWNYALAMYCITIPIILGTLYFQRRQE